MGSQRGRVAGRSRNRMLCVLKGGQFIKHQLCLGPSLAVRGSRPLWRGGTSSPECTLPSGATVIRFTKHGGRGGGAESNACPHLCQENPAGKQGVAYIACHKRVACADISPASMFPWQCVTGCDTCSREWGGGKVSRRNHTP